MNNYSNNILSMCSECKKLVDNYKIQQHTCNDVETLGYVYCEQCDINENNYEGFCTEIFKRGHIRCLLTLYEMGNEHVSLLTYEAAKTGRLYYLMYVIEKLGETVNQDMIWSAAENGQLCSLIYLCDICNFNITIYSNNIFINTLNKGHKQCYDYLIKNGAKFNYKLPIGQSPYYMLC